MKKIVATVFAFPVFSLAHLPAQTRPDSLQYAPGYPNYSVSQLDQLKSFPLPRYKPGNKLNRNFSWFDFLYMAYDYTKVVPGKSAAYAYPGWNTQAHGEAAVLLDREMYDHWNYYFNLPTPTYNWNTSAKPWTFNGAIVKYADDHPDIKTCTYIFWVGLRPKAAGFDSLKPFIKRNSNIDPCNGDTGYPWIVKDGLTQRFYLNELAKALPHRDSLRKIDFINENGEVFGQAWTPNAEGYRGNKMISCIQPDSGSARVMRAQWQYDVFNKYKTQFVANKDFPAMSKTDFSFYQVAGFLPVYYSEWSVMRKINSRFNGSYYSTPDFYPGDAKHNIFERYSFYHGLDCIAEGRKYEISLGDAYFSPFVCGGWWADSLNYRPAPWLAALKALAMMGAEFYYPAFFNTVNPAQKKPVDPRSYMYQVAMPAYAQAVTSRYEKIFFGSADFIYKNDDPYLLIYRKDKSGRYAIHASCFPKSSVNYSHQELFPKTVSVDGDQLKINFRRQGSTYIYDKSDPANIVFYQLDRWQESSHPYYWSKNFDFEAELYDDSIDFHLKTDRPVNAAPGDYTDFTTYVYFPSPADTKIPLWYHFEPRENDSASYYVWVRARSSDKNSSQLQVSVDGKICGDISNIHADSFHWYRLEVKSKPFILHVTPGQDHVVGIQAMDRFVEIDRILLSVQAMPLEVKGE